LLPIVFHHRNVQNDSPVDAYLDNQPANYSNSAPVINNYYNYTHIRIGSAILLVCYSDLVSRAIFITIPVLLWTGGRIVVCFPSYAYSNWFFSFGTGTAPVI